MLVRCRNSFGCDCCQWRGVYSDLVSHYHECDLASIPCPNKCLENNAVIKRICRKTLNEHLKSHCANREYACPQCSEMMMFREYAAHEKACRLAKCPYCNKVINISEQTTHDDTCLKKIVECPNKHKGCTVMMQRRSVRKHLLDICPYAEVACKYARIGCNKRMPRCDISTHESEDIAYHFPLAYKRLMELDDRVASIIRVALWNGKHMNFKLSNYQCRKEKQETFTSPEFSTPSGHSMAIKVQFGGNQISLSTKLIESPPVAGKAKESEPFDSSITICVLNQLKDNNHHFSKSKVQNLPKFNIAYSKIESTNQVAEVMYLKDDTLYFRVTCETSRPWLECREI